VPRAFDDPVDQRPEAEDRQHRTGPVERRLLGVAGGRQQHAAGDEGHDDHRHVDQEHRAPPEVLEQQPGGDRADGGAAAGDAGPHRDRLGALVGGEHVGEDRQGRGHHERSGEAHQGACPDDLGGRPGDGGEEGAGQEEAEAGLERALAAEPVADGAGGEEHPGEHQRVGVDHPLEVGGGGTEVAGEGGDGRVQRRVADDDDHQARAEHGQDPPPVGEHGLRDGG
jgi:hypothetical protein